MRLWTEEGKGTVFHIYLPVAEVESDASTGEPVEDPEELPGGSETVLLVEDDAALRRSAEKVLRGLGYRTIVASNGRHALAILEEKGDDIDLVLSDLVMPEIGGTELYRRLRASGRHVPFVLTTGYGARERAAASELGEELTVLQKPWALRELAACVRTALDRSRGESGA